MSVLVWLILIKLLNCYMSCLNFELKSFGKGDDVKWRKDFPAYRFSLKKK